jgi:hypothetical protein
MKGFSVIGIHRKGLLATELRVEISLTPHMTKAGFIELGRRTGGRPCRVGFGVGSGGCPAFAAVHQRISNGLAANL